MEQDGTSCPLNIWWDCIEEDMRSFSLSLKRMLAQSANKWTIKIKGATG